MFLLLLKNSDAAVAFDSCDCGFVDENRQFWTNQLYMTFNTMDQNDYQKKNNNHQQHYNPNNYEIQYQKLIKENFLANYVVGAKYENTYPRNFNKSNIKINKEGNLQISINIHNHNTDYPVSCGAMGTKRQDIFYGSFRSKMKLSGVNGTVAAMYFYHPDAEIDIEILGSVYPSQAYFAIHPGLVDEHNKASSLTHDNHYLSFDPSLDFHEYRFDWFQDRMEFYIDGIKAKTLITNVPSVPGRLMFSHWTDGNPKFSQGPPKTNAHMDIEYVVAIFNSSDLSQNNLNCKITQTPCSITDTNSTQSPNNNNHTSAGINQQPFYLVLLLFFIGYLVILI
ncbi:unnamed protein product [Cunninghamella blakesleeana]